MKTPLKKIFEIGNNIHSRNKKFGQFSLHLPLSKNFLVSTTKTIIINFMESVVVVVKWSTRFPSMYSDDPSSNPGFRSQEFLFRVV